MDKTVRKFASTADLDKIKVEEYRYWQSRPVYERADAVSELTQEGHAMKGFNELLSVLNAHGVKQLVVVAYAVSGRAGDPRLGDTRQR